MLLLIYLLVIVTPAQCATCGVCGRGLEIMSPAACGVCGRGLEIMSPAACGVCGRGLEIMSPVPFCINISSHQIHQSVQVRFSKVAEI